MAISSNFGYKTLIWWVFWIALQCYILIDFEISLNLSIVSAIVYHGILFVISFSIGKVMRYYVLAFENLSSFLYGIVLSVIVVFGHVQLVHLIFPQEKAFLAFIDRAVYVQFAFALLMIEFQMFMVWTYALMKKHKEEESRRIDTENMVREAELSKLRLQLQPHFLFNCLNSIYALVGVRPEEARKMLHQLSDFLRGTLKKDDQQLVRLDEELTHLGLYLDIEKVRFGSRLQTVIECDEASKTKLLPSLLLQPVVENAIKFGLYDTIGNIIIKIKAEIDEQKMLIISVENPYDPATSGNNTGTGFGLNSIIRRLYLLYARNDLLQTKQDTEIFTTIIKIPQSNV